MAEDLQTADRNFRPALVGVVFTRRGLETLGDEITVPFVRVSRICYKSARRFLAECDR